MTATDELRRMLDERGVEHWDTVGITEYRGENDRTVRCYARPEPMTLDVSIIAAPPEQAIEATLGRGACKNLANHKGRVEFVCSECGAHYLGFKFKHCPNCGRRCVG